MMMNNCVSRCNKKCSPRCNAGQYCGCVQCSDRDLCRNCSVRQDLVNREYEKFLRGLRLVVWGWLVLAVISIFLSVRIGVENTFLRYMEVSLLEGTFLYGVFLLIELVAFVSGLMFDGEDQTKGMLYWFVVVILWMGVAIHGDKYEKVIMEGILEFILVGGFVLLLVYRKHLRGKKEGSAH